MPAESPIQAPLPPQQTIKEKLAALDEQIAEAVATFDGARQGELEAQRKVLESQMEVAAQTPENEEAITEASDMAAVEHQDAAELVAVQERLGMTPPQGKEKELTEAEILQRDFDRNLKNGSRVSEYLSDARHKGIKLEYDEGELKNALTNEAASALQRGGDYGAIKAISMGERLGFQIEFDKNKMKQAMEMSIKISLDSSTDPFYLIRRAREWGISIDTQDERMGSVLRKKFYVWHDMTPENAKTLIEEGIITYKELPTILNDKVKEVLKIGRFDVHEIANLATKFESKLGIRLDLSDPKLASILRDRGYEDLVNEYNTPASKFRAFMEKIGLKQRWTYSYGLNRTEEGARAEREWMDKYSKS